MNERIGALRAHRAADRRAAGLAAAAGIAVLMVVLLGSCATLTVAKPEGFAEFESAYAAVYPCRGRRIISGSDPRDVQVILLIFQEAGQDELIGLLVIGDDLI